MTKKVLALLCVLAVMLSAAGCTSTNEPVEDNSSSSITQEDIDALKEENERLQKELDELKGETSDTEQDAETGSSSEGEETDASSAAADTQTSSAPASTNSASADTSSAPAASSQAPATNTPAPNTQKTNSGGKGPLAKYTVNVKDSNTPATDVKGKTVDGVTGYMFYSADGKLLGIIPTNTVSQIIRENDLMYAEEDEQKSWFVEQFNVYRGLDGSSSDYNPSQSSGSNSSEIDIDEYREEVIRLTNIERKKAGLDSVTADDTAMEYAQIRAEELAVSYSHTRPNNREKEMDGLYFIENIAYGQKSPSEVVNDWMNSAGHRATLLSDYSEVGNRIGVGCYQANNGTIYWCQEFVGWDSEG